MVKELLPYYYDASSIDGLQLILVDVIESDNLATCEAILSIFHQQKVPVTENLLTVASNR